MFYSNLLEAAKVIILTDKGCIKQEYLKVVFPYK
jgi:hypothetical protein